MLNVLIDFNNCKDSTAGASQCELNFSCSVCSFILKVGEEYLCAKSMLPPKQVVLRKQETKS